MARGPRSRASRAERRMQKERAASALAHGLPVPTPLPTRVRGSDLRTSRPPAADSNLRTPTPSSASGGLPLAVKLVGFGLGLLGLVYGLTVFRDHLASVEASLATSASAHAPVPPSLGASLNAASLNPEPASSASVK
ncbi:MAG: hypothetical protein ABW061_11035 [Polyangiaceae bacterium]